MDKIAHPLPTAAELKAAIVILSRTFQSLGIKHGLIESSAIFLHASAFSLPCLLPSSITILIQPSQQTSAVELTCALGERRYASDFKVTRRNGVEYPTVIIKRPKPDLRGDLFVKLTLVDHWICHERREAYDFRWPGNDTVPLMVGGEQVHVLDPAWLLRQKIRTGIERVRERERRTDEIYIKALVDVLEFRGSRKIKYRRKKDIEDLGLVVIGMDRDDPMVLGSVIHCPQVFGPWWDLIWVRAVGLIGGALLSMTVMGLYGPDNEA